MGYLLYLMFRCDRRCDRCDGKFGNLVGTKHTLGIYAPETGADEIRDQTHARVNGKCVCDFTREGSKGKEKEEDWKNRWIRRASGQGQGSGAMPACR